MNEYDVSGMELAEENRSTRRKKHVPASLSTKNPICSGLGLIQELHGEWPWRVRITNDWQI